MKKISIQGFPGAFHHIAAANYEGEPVEVIGRRTFDEVITDVMDDDSIDYGMMAIENSIAGSLLRNYTLIQDSKVQIIGETYLRIKQNLLALPGVRMEDLKEVHSHPIALAQCEDFFSHYPDVQLVSTFDTAESAYEISLNGSRDIGAIASSLAGEMYELNTLAASIETNKQNYTRFLVLDDKMPDQEFDKISISFRVSHAIGSLYKALENLSLNKCNLTKIQSVPIIGEPWQYLFFADFVLAEPERLDEIIDDLSHYAQGVRVLGKYKEGTIMKVRPSQRVSEVEEYYFSKKLKEIARLKSEGKPIINLGIGSPDQPPHAKVREVFSQEVVKDEGHGYQSYYGIPELRKAFSDWYMDRYGVAVDPDTQVLPLIGSKEGIMHISMSFLDPGDEVLVPNPGYPTYQSATRLAGGKNRLYDLDAENGWLPDLGRLSQEDLTKVRLMWVNYPHMPTGSQADPSFWEKLVAFGEEHDILICHDNPYSFILNPEPRSIFSVPGAWYCCLELNSLSKSHNMAGWRIGAVIGANKFLSEIIKFKSNMDSGMFRPLQLAAVEALKQGDDWYDDLNAMYRERKEIAYKILDDLGCDYEKNQAGLFAWGKVPSVYEDGYAMSDELLYESNVFITPGGIFGTQGEQYIRISICIEAEELGESEAKSKAIN